MKCFDLTLVNALRIPGGMKKAVVCCLNPRGYLWIPSGMIHGWNYFDLILVKP